MKFVHEVCACSFYTKEGYDMEYCSACLSSLISNHKLPSGSAENETNNLLYLPDSSELSSSELSELSESDESSFETGLAAPPPTAASASASSTTLHKIHTTHGSWRLRQVFPLTHVNEGG